MLIVSICKTKSSSSTELGELHEGIVLEHVDVEETENSSISLSRCSFSNLTCKLKWNQILVGAK